MTATGGVVPIVAGMGRRPWWALLLLPGGWASGHVLGYWATGAGGWMPSLTTGHGYLADLTTLAAPLTVAVVLRAFASGARGEALPMRLGSLAALQVLVYVAVELAEHLAAGMSVAASLLEPSMLIGALAQLLIAGGLVCFVRLVHRAGEAVWATRARPLARRPRPRLWVLTVRTWAQSTVHTGSLSRRGPPARISLPLS